MVKKIIKTTITLFILIAFLFINSSKISAQASRIDLSISPPVTYLSIKPGEKQTYNIIAQNLGDTTLEIIPSILDFEANDLTGQPQIKDSNTFKYIKINEGLSSFSEIIIIKPNKSLNIPITIEIPKGQSEGEHTMTIFFSFRKSSEQQNKNSQAKIAGKIGSNLIVLVTNNNQDRGEIIINNIKTFLMIDSFMPIKFSVLAENIGKNATPANGSATITNWQNKEIANFEIHPDMILSGSSRELREKDFLSNEFRYKEPFLIGIYDLKVELKNNSSPDSEVTSLNKKIIALPFSFILLPLAGFLLYSGYREVLKRTKV